MATCAYRLHHSVHGTLYACGEPASYHIRGVASVPRGIDAEGSDVVQVEGHYCPKHTVTMRNRLGTHTATSL